MFGRWLHRTPSALALVVASSVAARAQVPEPLSPLNQTPRLTAAAQSELPPAADSSESIAPPAPEEQPSAAIESTSTTDTSLEVIAGQGRLLTLEAPLAEVDQPSPVIATGDPTVVDFEVLGPRQIRVTGQRLGVTDLSILTASEEPLTIEVRVVADLPFLRARLRQLYPDASLRVSHLRQHVVVEGQARSPQQVHRIIETVEAFLETVAPPPAGGGATTGPGPGQRLPVPEEAELPEMQIVPEMGRPAVGVAAEDPEVINLIEVPGPQQVLLKVKIAELNRTALRQLGISTLLQDAQTAVGTNLGNLPATRIDTAGTSNGLMGLLDPVLAGNSAFAVFDAGEVSFFIDALQRNQIFKTLAEPTLVAMHGEEASFLSGGEFPVPVPQSGAATGAITIQYRDFGVGLDFVPFILDDETVRLAVAPEVSSIDFSLGIVQAGVEVPALNTRRTKTVVELRQGQTLAISGLLQVDLNGTSEGILGLADLPYIGPLFRNSSMRRTEKELVVLVTPYLVQPLEPHEVAPPPGAEVGEPNDHELFWEGQLESPSGRDYRSTTGETSSAAAAAAACVESVPVFGPHGYTR